MMLEASQPSTDGIWMERQRWPPGASVLFAVVTSLALWALVVLVLSVTIG